MSGVYIVEFDIYPGLYKIGKSKDIENRVKQFQNSTILLNSNVKLVYCKEFENYTKAERDVHTLLTEYRCKDNREFFKGDLNLFINTIDSLNEEEYKNNSEEVKKESFVNIDARCIIPVLENRIKFLEEEVQRLKSSDEYLFSLIKQIVLLLPDKLFV